MTSVLRSKCCLTLHDPKTEVLLFWDECTSSLQQWHPSVDKSGTVKWYSFERPRREQIVQNGAERITKIVKNVKIPWESLK